MLRGLLMALHSYAGACGAFLVTPVAGVAVAAVGAAAVTATGMPYADGTASIELVPKLMSFRLSVSRSTIGQQQDQPRPTHHIGSPRARPHDATQGGPFVGSNTSTRWSSVSMNPTAQGAVSPTPGVARLDPRRRRIATVENFEKNKMRWVRSAPAHRHPHPHPSDNAEPLDVEAGARHTVRPAAMRHLALSWRPLLDAETGGGGMLGRSESRLGGRYARGVDGWISSVGSRSGS